MDTKTPQGSTQTIQGVTLQITYLENDTDPVHIIDDDKKNRVYLKN